MQISNKTLFKTQAFINGKWVNSDKGETYPVNNPATGELIAECASCGMPETRRAIEAAEAAMPAWRKRSAKDRAAIV
ncbi:MAG: aldehyde dehydrogenase family protein, partial [Gammaproteobacteria bacterium]|nr:aldehyde dehydrogenase family protein [Gammaproteobacteria bacterium]